MYCSSFRWPCSRHSTARDVITLHPSVYVAAAGFKCVRQLQLFTARIDGRPDGVVINGMPLLPLRLEELQQSLQVCSLVLPLSASFLPHQVRDIAVCAHASCESFWTSYRRHDSAGEVNAPIHECYIRLRHIYVPLPSCCPQQSLLVQCDASSLACVNGVRATCSSPVAW